MIRSEYTGKTYAELAPIPAPLDSNGRIYIYRTEESTETSLVGTPGIHATLQKNYIPYVVDDQVFEHMWEAFIYHDLPAGTHELSIDNVTYKVGWAYPKIHYKRGDQKQTVTLQSGEELYFKIAIIANQAKFFQVQAAIAKAEMAKLPIYKWLEPTARVE